MKQGKQICETLKAIRSEIAIANEIDYQPTECNHEGECAGTCPKCESEMRWLERQLRNRQALGKAVTIAGLSVALGAMSSCHPKIFQPDGYLEPINTPQDTVANKGIKTPPSTLIVPVDSTEEPIQLMGDVACMPDTTAIQQPKKTTK